MYCYWGRTLPINQYFQRTNERCYSLYMDSDLNIVLGTAVASLS